MTVTYKVEEIEIDNKDHLETRLNSVGLHDWELIKVIRDIDIKNESTTTFKHLFIFIKR